MRYCNSIFGSVLKPILRRQFDADVARHGANAYDKSFDSWDHLVALLYAQLAGCRSLRALEASWNANAHHHYHLGSGTVARSTLADANARRPVAPFVETFERLSGLADREMRREGREMLRLIDATPIPLGKLIGWAKWNGRTRGLKLHVVYDPAADNPQRIAITHSTVNDVEVGEQVPIEAGATYIYDKAYCKYAWWTRLHEAAAFFVTRSKTNARYKAVRRRPLKKIKGEGFRIVDDCEVKLASKGNSKLPIPLRRVRVKRDDGATLTLITNDLKRSAVEIASLYKTRWQIELLFRWIKQHLKIRNFLGHSKNAIRLQLVAAMIAFLLLRLAARQNRITMPAIRFAEMVSGRLFMRKHIAEIDKPPDVNPSKPKPRHSHDQMELCYA
jgi:putative transposase